MNKLIIVILFILIPVFCFSQDTIKTQYVITNWGKANTKYEVQHTIKEKNGKIKVSKVKKDKLKDLIDISKQKKKDIKKGGKAGGFGVKSEELRVKIEVDSTQYKKLVSDYENLIKYYKELFLKNEASLTFEQKQMKTELDNTLKLIEYLQYQIQEEKKKLN